MPINWAGIFNHRYIRDEGCAACFEDTRIHEMQQYGTHR